MRCSIATALVLAALCAGTRLPSQVPPGQYLACARVPGGEMFLCDPKTRTTTALTIPATLQNDWPNCVWMDSPATGFVGTFNNPGVYSIVIAGTTVTATALNTASLPAANECTQLVRIGNTIYVAQWDKLSSIPVGGGAPTQVLDLTTLTGWPTGGICNAIATDGVSKIYMAIWTGGALYSYDVGTQTTSLMLTLPMSKASATATFSPVHAQMKFPAALGQLVVAGLNGDVALIDTATATVKQHWYHPSASGTGLSPSKDALFENVDSGDWAIGTRDGAIDVLVPVGTEGQLARRDIENVGSGATPNLNRVVAIWYSPATASYAAFGGGCAGTGGFVPTSVGRGPAKAGNAAFAFGVDGVNANASVALVFGSSNSAPYPLDLASIGMPGCFLRTNGLVSIGATATGTAAGLGYATVPVPLPNITGNAFTQWVALDAGANALGVVMSDARELKL